jgi:hypothetical protein
MLLSPAFGGPLEEASLHKVINDVRLVDPASGVRPAVVGDVIQGSLGVKTGIKSRAELVFQDETLTRLGPETFFSFDPGTRDMTLGYGTMLLQVPKHIGGARIHTAAITASILGTTIMIEYLPGNSLKVVVLEGTLRLSLDHVLGESVLLHPGNMTIMRPDAKRIPDPVQIDLRLLTKTSRLINPDLFKADSKDVVKELPSTGLIDQQIAMQDVLKGSKGLIDTNLVIPGQGTGVLLATKQQLAALDDSAQVVLLSASPTPAPSSTPSPAAPSATPFPAGPVTNPSTTLQSSASSVTGGANPTISVGTATYPGAIYYGAAVDGPAVDFLFGGDSPFSLKVDLNSRFGTEGHSIFPAAGIAAYKFANLTLQGDPTFNTASGPSDVALIGVGGITDGGGGLAWNLSGLKGLFLGANQGSITLSNGSALTATSGSLLKWLQFYADGAAPGQGDLTLDAAISIPTATLDVDAANNVTIGCSSLPVTDTADAMNIYGEHSVTVNDNLDADYIRIASGGATTINGALNTKLFIGDGATFDVTGNLGIYDDVVTGDLNVAGTIDPSLAGTVTTMRTLRAGGLTALGGLNFGGLDSVGLTNNPTDGSELTLLSSGNITFATNAIDGADFVGGNSWLNSNAPGGNGGILDIGTNAHPIGGNVTIDVPVWATTGGNALSLATGGKGGTVKVVSRGAITVNSSVKVSDTTPVHESAQGGNISLTSLKKKGQAITVSNSGQLLALLAAAAPGPGGTITLTSAGGAIDVNGGTVDADRGTIEMRNNGASGVVNLTDANLSANVLKVGALGSNGELIINGGTLSANGAIELYARGSNGTVLFDGDVTLNGNSTKTIAGDTVTIGNGITVTIGGSQQASVYTNNPNYNGSGGNGSTSGQFAGAGASTHPFSGAPKF